MASKSGIQQIGDHRDIPLAVGLVVIAWNACEDGMRRLITSLATRQRWENARLAEILVSEMGTLGLTQAIRCYADEIPKSDEEIAGALRHLAELAERLKAYRNYYVHGITRVTQYGLLLDDEAIEADTPVSEAMTMGPFGMVMQHSAKGRSKFIWDFVAAEQIIDLNNRLATAVEYIEAVGLSVNHFLRDLKWRKSAPLPAPPPLPSVLVKPELRHPKIAKPPALIPDAERRRRLRKMKDE